GRQNAKRKPCDSRGRRQCRQTRYDSTSSLNAGNSIQADPEDEDQYTDHGSSPTEPPVKPCVLPPEEQESAGPSHESQGVHPFKTPGGSTSDHPRGENREEGHQVCGRGIFDQPLIDQRWRAP